MGKLAKKTDGKLRLAKQLGSSDYGMLWLHFLKG